ncbi:hypothetical protein C7H19_24135 [Aphanothece hegewaldii CCALA 016]|uniref:Uncharacterized protein n=1 Tax=Aphanothece hegewaldii CCALA 016 TaxID=2107694 RepID=A0A2T1LR01_9CHRO|nr:hypothetical protein [Aphanothece hegewaldii]PSF30019.1 hypothetical protein C7H19_24135 [Aphanothece hegewaldii CCALA 016]
MKTNSPNLDLGFFSLDFSHKVLLAYHHQEIFPRMSDFIISMESYIKAFKPESILVLGSVSQDDYKVVVSWAFSHSPELKRETWIPLSFWMQQQASLELERFNEKYKIAA